MSRTVPKGATADGWACKQPAPLDYWDKVYASPRPVLCNRAPGHDGPHRRYRGDDYALLAEWSDADVPAP